MPTLRNIIIILAVLFIPLRGTYYHLQVLGAFRPHPPPSLKSSPPEYVQGARLITQIKQAEDFALHAPSHLLILTAPSNETSRYGWWPPAKNLDRPEDALTADTGIWTLHTQVSIPIQGGRETDIKTWEARRITIKDFSGPFVAHGLDIYSPPSQPDTIYLHAVNHKPADHGPHKANSTIEIFRVDLSSFTATHIQTVYHPLITTPNDIYSIGASEFLVTNDHAKREGLLRTAEELLTLKLASHTNIIHVNAVTPSGVQASIVKKGIHSANGLGHGPEGEIILNDASGGVLHTLSPDHSTTSSLQFTNTVDNPTYFSDPYATPTSDLSGYVVAGLLQGIKFDEHTSVPGSLAPSVVWLVRKREGGKWDKMKVLEDDGSWLNGATTAMVLPIDPRLTSGRREAWVIATGCLSSGVGVARVDLTDWGRK